MCVHGGYIYAIKEEKKSIEEKKKEKMLVIDITKVLWVLFLQTFLECSFKTNYCNSVDISVTNAIH